MNTYRLKTVVNLLLAGLLTALLGACGDSSDDTVRQAYELRMEGKADSALVILSEMVTADSSNADAWFEYARAMHHYGLGNPRALFGGMQRLRFATEQAVLNAPDNVTYAFYNSYISFLWAYMSFMVDQTVAAERVRETVNAYEAVLELKPDYTESMLFLVEILSAPATLGGDSLRAREYAARLAAADPVLGAKAEELLLPEEASRVEYWQTVLQAHPDDARVLEQLGKSYLYQDEIETGMNYLEEAIQADSNLQLLWLDMARFYLMAARQDTTQAETVLPAATAAVKRYLASEPIRPLRGFAVNMLAWIKEESGNSEASMQLREEAQALDPNVSRAFGIPPALLFEQPEAISHYHSYFFRPF